MLPVDLSSIFTYSLHFRSMAWSSHMTGVSAGHRKSHSQTDIGADLTDRGPDPGRAPGCGCGRFIQKG
eukprot:1743816-Rhodomonas_salina.4